MNLWKNYGIVNMSYASHMILLSLTYNDFIWLYNTYYLFIYICLFMCVCVCVFFLGEVKIGHPHPD